MATVAQKMSVSGLPALRSRASVVRPLNYAKGTSGGKTDVTKTGVNSIEDPAVKANLQGRSKVMKSKDWVDPQGRRGTGKGVYQFEDKYGANVDGYSPIYTPDIWAESGNSYKLGTRGLIAWAGLVLVLLLVGINLILSTSQLGQ